MRPEPMRIAPAMNPAPPAAMSRVSASPRKWKLTTMPTIPSPVAAAATYCSGRTEGASGFSEGESPTGSFYRMLREKSMHHTPDGATTSKRA